MNKNTRITKYITGQNALNLREVSNLGLVSQSNSGNLPQILCPLSSRKIINYTLIIAALFLLIACGRGRPTGPATAIPPNVVRPDQPAPIYTLSANTFNLTPTVPGIDVSQRDMALGDDGLDDYVARQQNASIPDQPNSALGITQSAVTLFSQPYDPAANSKSTIVQNLPGGSVVTITGRSYDERYLAVYTAAGVTGWLRLQDVILYGGGDQGQDLPVVTQSIGPTALATALAEAMHPVPFSTIAIPTLRPTRSAAIQPAARPQLAPVNRSVNGSANVATEIIQVNRTSNAMAEVLDVAYLDVYAEPDFGAAIIAQIDYGTKVSLLSKNDIGDWVEVPISAGSGWAPVMYLRVDASMDTLPIRP